MTEETKPPKMTLTKNADFKSIYSTGVFGSLSPVEGRMIFYVDRPLPSMEDTPPYNMKVREIQREMLVEIHMPAQQWLAMFDWMKFHIDELKKKGILEAVDVKKVE